MSARNPTNRAKNLRALLAEDGAGTANDVEIVDLTLDSRKVQPGCAFVALPGARTHGVGFAAQAAQAGARAILWEPVVGVAAPRAPNNACVVAIPDLTLKLGGIADRFFDAPSSGMRVVGVTGTNGKTTTAHVIAEALHRIGESSAYAGTLGHGRIGAISAGTHTTPDVITVHRQLAELRDDGVRLLAMEVTSHALDQHRVDGVRFDSAIFTNLTRDHLDYHGTFEAYGEAKTKLFAWPGLKRAAINIEDPYGRTLVERSKAGGTLRYGRSPDADLFAPRALAGAHGLDIEIAGRFGGATLHSRFVGDFNVDNVLAALAALINLGVPFTRAVAAIEQCNAPPGRMETLSAPGRPLAIIDYAHTPDALEKALFAARRHCTGELTCVFGCGGDRDAGKRPLMAAIAERLADRIIVTDDNPRTEDGDAIVADILKGFSEKRSVIIERDRARAIALALSEGGEGDVALIAGKGHEDYQIVGVERRHFSDREVAAAALEEEP